MLNHRIDVSIACQRLFGRELIAIRVRVVKRRKCLSLLYHLLYRLVSNNTVRVIRRVILEIYGLFLYWMKMTISLINVSKTDY